MRLTINTKKKREVVDITRHVENFLSGQDKLDGLVNVFCIHTTAAVACADLDPGTDLDLLDTLEAMIPNVKFRHEHKPEHAPDHILGTILGPSVTIPYIDKNLILGTWQKVILVELDGPREREIVVSVV